MAWLATAALRRLQTLIGGEGRPYRAYKCMTEVLPKPTVRATSRLAAYFMIAIKPASKISPTTTRR